MAMKNLPVSRSFDEGKTVSTIFTGVYSMRSSASTGAGRLKQWWGRDVFHLTSDGKKTLCGRDCTEYGRLDEADADNVNCCERCASRAKE